MRKKLGLALGSGGARGIAHVGFLQALDEAGIKADFVTGCSMGSVVGACYCAGVPVSEMKERALKLRLSQIASLNVAPI
ncbi:MAG: patatin-like phospholipase family protein, partial [Clostridia bacterium]|nr:patatin-like phospholipase family protein [Clostridia bacterium]